MFAQYDVVRECIHPYLLLIEMPVVKLRYGQNDIHKYGETRKKRGRVYLIINTTRPELFTAGVRYNSSGMTRRF